MAGAAAVRRILSAFDEATNSAGFTFTSRPISGDRWRASAPAGAARRWGAARSAKRKQGVVVARTKLTASAYCK